jgi:hypothetical protein
MKFYQVADVDLHLLAALSWSAAQMAAGVAELRSRTSSIEQILRTVE